MNKFDNIEEIFKSTLKDHKVNAGNGTWNNIKQNISQHASSSSVSGMAQTTVLKVVTGVIIASGLAIGGYYVFQSSNNSKTEQSKTIQTNNNDTKENRNNAIANKDVTTTKGTTTTTNSKSIVGANPEQKDIASTVNLDSKDKTATNSNNQKAQITQNKEGNENSKHSENNNQKQSSNQQQSTADENSKTKTEQTGTNNQVNKNETKTNLTDELSLNINVSKSNSKTINYEIAYSSKTNAEHISWNFGDGSSEAQQKTGNHKYDSPGTYTIVATAYSEVNGERNTTKSTQTITFKPKAEISFVPNVITPNGDGINDMLKIKAQNIQSFSIKIFKGDEMIYSAHNADPNKMWDGKNRKGEYVEDGNYHYVIIGIDNDGKSIEPKMGKIYVNR